MIYKSTRGNTQQVSGTMAVILGLAEDGGLFVPTEIPTVDIASLSTMSYKKLAKKILSLYFDEFSEKQLNHIVGQYDVKFKASIAPVTSFDNVSFLELYHGPTASFKDMALTLLPEIIKASYEVNDRDESILMLVATSGDTGSAALSGFVSQPKTKIGVFYPTDGVSPVQMMQMESIEGNNTFTYAIEGNFDDAQKTVKELFSDVDINKLTRQHQLNLTTANSINIGRLVSQIVYYFSAYYQLVDSGKIRMGEQIDISVPTGNFGDILAGIYAKEMGLPIDQTICASNSNNVLTEFFDTGVYDAKRSFYKTHSPSMDILVSSNLERFLYLISNGDTKLI